MPLLRLAVAFAVLASLLLTSNRALAMGLILGETPEELKLKYEVKVQDHQTGRVTVVLTITDDGRLKPIEAIELMITPKEKEKDGSSHVDLSVPINTGDEPGKKVARVHITKELAERAQFWLTTYSMDGKKTVMERMHLIIPIAKYLPASEAKKN